MRLIDADALKPLLREYCVDDDEVVMKWYDIMGVDEVVDRAPTIDAVPVVRCKDCKRWDEVTQVCDKFSHPHCAHLVGATGFCKWAERKDNDGQR